MLYWRLGKKKGREWYVFLKVYEKEGEMSLIIGYMRNKDVRGEYL